MSDNIGAVGHEMQVFEVLMKTSATLLSGRGLSDVLNTILQGIQAVGFDRVRLYLLSKDKKYMMGKAHVGMDETFLKFQMLIAGDSLLEDLVGSPDLSPRKMQRRDNKPFRYDKELGREGVNEWVYLPLIWNKETIGLMVADNKSSKRPITDEIFSPLTIFTSQAAAAIASIQHAEQLKTVQQMALELTAEWDTARLLQRIIRQATKLLGAKSGGIYEYDPETELLTIVADYNHPENLNGKTLRLGEGMAGQLVKSRLPYLIEKDYENSPGRADIYEGKRLFGAVIEVLLKWQEGIVGVLYVDDEVGRQFTEQDAELLQLFAVQAAAAIKSAEQKAEAAVQKERFRELVESAPNAIIANNRDGIITFFNKEAEKILGFKAKEVIKKKRVVDIFARPENAYEIGEMLDQPLHRVIDYRTRLKDAEKKNVPIRLSATRIYDSQGQHVETVGHFVDVRNIQAKERDLPLLLDASNLLAKAENLVEGLQGLAEMLVTRFGNSFCRVFLLEERGEPYLTLKAVYPLHKLSNGLTWEPGLEKSTRISDWPGLDGLLKSGKPRILDIHNNLSREILKRWSQMVGLSQDIQYLLVVPLRTHEKVVGLLDLGELRLDTQVPFEDMRMLATAVAEQTAVLIDRFHLHETTKIAQSMLQTSYEASKVLLSAQDPEQVSSKIVGKPAGKMAGATGVRMLLFNPVTHQFDDYATPPNSFKPVRKDGFTQKVFATGRVVKLPDVENIKGEIQPPPTFEEREIKAAIGLPLFVEEKTIGVIWFYYDKPRDFSEWEIEALQLYANQAAMAYENSRQIEELKRLGQASYKLTGATSVKEVLDLIVQTANEVLGGDSAVFWAYDNQRSQFILENSIAHNIPDEQWQTFLKAEPRPRGRVKSIMKQGWVSVPDMDETVEDAILGEATRRRLSGLGVNSFQGVTLTAGGEKFGILYVNYAQARKFNKEDREKALTFATHAALALKTVKLLEQVHKAHDSARAIAKVTTSVNGLEEMLPQIAAEMQKTLNCDVVTLHIYEPDRQKLIYPAVTTGVRHPERIPPPNSEFLIPPLLETFLQAEDKTYLIEDIVNDPRFQNSRFSQDEDIASCMVIRLTVHTEIVGIIFLSYRTRRRFTVDEEKSMELFADQAAVAIRNAQLLERSQKHVTALEALIKAGRAVTSSLNLTETLHEIAEAAYQVAQEKKPTRQDIYVSIWLVASSSRVFVMAVYPLGELEVTRGIFPDGIDLNEPDGKFGIVGLAIHTKKLQVISPVAENPHYLSSHPKTVSELAVPVILENEVIGAINVELTAKDAFDGEDVDIFQSLADQAAVAIDKARRYDELLRMIGGQTALNWLAMAHDGLYHVVGKKASSIAIDVASLRQIMKSVQTTKRVTQQVEKILERIEICAEQIRKERPPYLTSFQANTIAINQLITNGINELWELQKYVLVSPPNLILDDTLNAQVLVSPPWLYYALDLLLENSAK